MGDRQTDTQTDRQNLWNLEVLTHLKTKSELGVKTGNTQSSSYIYVMDIGVKSFSHKTQS